MKVGNKNHISFELIGDNLPQQQLNLNFYLGNKMISNESVYVPTYILSLQNLIDDIKYERFTNIKFEGTSVEEDFKILLKERDLDETQFFKHLFLLDETIDQYTIFVFQINELIRFVWTCNDEHNCNYDHELNKIYSVQFLAKELISTVNGLINRLNIEVNN